MSDQANYDAVNNPYRRRTFRRPPPPPRTASTNFGESTGSPTPQPNENHARIPTAEEVYGSLRDIYPTLCQNLSTATFGSVLELFPDDETRYNIVRAYTRFEQAQVTPQALALCLWCVFETLHQGQAAVSFLPHKLVQTLQRLERQYEGLPKHTGSGEALYNHIYGMLAYCTVREQAITMQELQKIFQTYNAADPILACFDDWLERSEAAQVRGNVPNKALFWKNIWSAVRGYLDFCCNRQDRPQHLLIQVMVSMTTWHATLCILEGIRDRGVDGFVTSEGASLRPPQNATQPPAPVQIQQQPAPVPPMQPSVSTGPAQEDPGQAATQSGAAYQPFLQNQQYPAGRAGVPSEPQAPFPNFEAPHPPPPNPPEAGKRCERCAEKHIRCDNERPCSNCRKVGRQADECIPRETKRRGPTKTAVQGGGKPSWAAERPDPGAGARNMGGGKPSWVAERPDPGAEARDVGEPSVGMEQFEPMGELAMPANQVPEAMGDGEVEEGGAAENDEAGGGNYNYNYPYTYGDADNDPNPRDQDYHE
ncbi:hypothetical protein CLAFUW4_12734 [Fulvia fulva]|uniref:Zn(2)-C6 fungal-type domain-containing protein n=1 Tax=Passalora fulva TaxID=5499 RepID=A0A9Q8PJT3_PASFU|nr:uncharacterized protein CLAFUR5_12600 [Fulvia fulva]KAK4612216.1 hypothetical protein CLAFUR4_12738 [Fulvia fulva]KAK4612802.1 hypothetical protein CLAFUR0_12745 [Fulvia fulva]UJO23717.1 hypothetical protein CLAFUR5_12600 [Fulvia fulva]WPV21165.1 hypothetical protein CLAFUW4_12734 [Fulvia fulva]WPV36179.1 hypothetical protein CLAFUW7_12741 [Fulvia fulva]